MAASCEVPQNPVKNSNHSGWLGFLERKFADIIGLNLKSLAVFRIGLGFTIILDILIRFQDISWHYTDNGVLPRTFLIDNYLHPWNFSLYLLGGSEFFVGLLFLITIFLAVLLILGYKTRIVVFALWILTISLHNRMPLVLNAGDILLRMLLFWSLFLPISAKYSLENAFSGFRQFLPTKTVSIATFAFMVQLSLVYIFSYLFKTHDIWHGQGSAIYYALSIDQFTTRIGYILYGFPAIMWGLSKFILYFEGFGTFFAFSPIFRNFFRTLIPISFMLFHVGLAICMFLGIFPLIAIVAWIPFLPESFWNFLGQLLVSRRYSYKIYYDDDCNFCKKTVKLITTFLALPYKAFPAQSTKSVFSKMEKHNSWVLKRSDGRFFYKFDGIWMLLADFRLFNFAKSILPNSLKQFVRNISNKLYNWIANHRDFMGKATSWISPQPIPNLNLGIVASLIAFLALNYILLWNLRTYDFNAYSKIFPTSVNTVANVTRIDQVWDMFSPKPLTDDGWFILNFKYTDGSEYDQWNDQPTVYTKPEMVSKTFENQRWRKYMMNLWLRSYSSYRTPYLEAVCYNYKNSKPQSASLNRLQSIELIYMQEDTYPNYQTSRPQKVLLESLSCVT